MRDEFNNLVELMNRYDLYQKDDEVGDAISELESKITEIEKRLECARRSNQDSNSIIMKLVESYQDRGAIEEKLTYGDFEVLQRGVYDVDIALNFNDNEPITENWYGLFEENVSRETKVLIPKDSIVEWSETRKYYNANGGAKARVLEDYTTEHESNDKCINVEWLDDKANGQSNGGYHLDMFKEEFDKPMKIIDTTMGKDMVEDIIQKLIQLDVDGETMQYIIDQVGMTDQMLRQLVMNTPTSETIDLLEEKRMISDEHLTQK
jgi:hypothetical protein